jgi:hypothetical protein
MAPNFTVCAEVYKNASSQTPNPYGRFAYTGPIHGVLRLSDRPTVITAEGCLALCGHGIQPYAWTQASNTITTWVLPVVGGLLVQAPFESNKSWRTFFAFVRWIGSPMSSLSHVLWNIKVTGKCALMVDMAVRVDEVPRDQESEFSQMRDAFYILAVMNQYRVKSRMPGIAAEKLLRIALFSDSLKLTHDEADSKSLPKLRKALAYDLRRSRRRGIVPIFISIGWFLISLGISVESAFGNLGENATAHNLALGLLLGWLPVFVLGSIIDRSPMSSDDVRLRLNDLLDKVRLALLDVDLRDTYIKDTGRAPDDYRWTQGLDNEEYFSASFFSDFAGQGRSRWHYGVAHPILAGIEKAYVADYGRDWLRDSGTARTALVVGPEQPTGLQWFDWREIWQILWAVTIVLGTVTGAFVISYWTPTVGLGCRSGGYVIFILPAFTSLSIEMLIYWLTTTQSGEDETLGCARRATMADPLVKVGSRNERKLPRSWSHRWQVSMGEKIRNLLHAWEILQSQSKIEILVLKPLDVVNTAWLMYIVSAQTFGWYRKCSCFASTWAGGGGYIDFESNVSYKAHGVSIYWGAGTALSLIALSLAVLFIIAEWCSQSHLSTMNYEAAKRGLRRTRSWKYHTAWLRRAPNAIFESMVAVCCSMIGLISKTKSANCGKQSLVWSANVKTNRHSPPIVLYGISISDGVGYDDYPSAEQR